MNGFDFAMLATFVKSAGLNGTAFFLLRFAI